jgi:hypothetical protein
MPAEGALYISAAICGVYCASASVIGRLTPLHGACYEQSCVLLWRRVETPSYGVS